LAGWTGEPPPQLPGRVESDAAVRRRVLSLAALESLRRAVFISSYPRVVDLDVVYQPQIMILTMYLEHVRAAKERRMARKRYQEYHISLAEWNAHFSLPRVEPPM